MSGAHRPDPTRTGPPPRRQARLAVLLAAVALVAIGAVGGLGIAGREQTLDATQDSRRDLATEVLDDCATGQASGESCRRAAEIQAEPVAGTDGTDGRDGQDGRDGIDGKSPACLSEVTLCRGKDGADGRDGVDGVDGRDGQNGMDGADGTPGRDGSPAASYTMTFPDGSTQTCTRDGGPDTAPAYRCAAVQPSPSPEPEPEPDPGPPPDDGGLLGP